MKKIIAYIVLFILLVVFILKTDFDFSVIYKMDLIDFLLLSTVILLSYINTFFAIFIQLKMLDVDELRSNIAYLSLASNLLNYLPAKGGMLSLGTFLKVKKNVPLNKFVFTSIIFYILVIIVTLVLALFFLFDKRIRFIFDKIDFFNITIVFGVFILLLSFLYIYAKKNKELKFSQYYILLLSKKQLIINNKLNLLYISLIIVVGIILFTLRMYICFSIANHEISLYESFLIGIITNLSFFLSFTPGGLGIKEGFVASVSYLLFNDAALGVIASLIDRVVNLLYTLITGVVSIKVLEKRYFQKK